MQTSQYSQKDLQWIKAHQNKKVLLPLLWALCGTLSFEFPTHVFASEWHAVPQLNGGLSIEVIKNLDLLNLNENPTDHPSTLTEEMGWDGAQIQEEVIFPRTPNPTLKFKNRDGAVMARADLNQNGKLFELQFFQIEPLEKSESLKWILTSENLILDHARNPIAKLIPFKIQDTTTGYVVQALLSDVNLAKMQKSFSDTDNSWILEGEFQYFPLMTARLFYSIFDEAPPIPQETPWLLRGLQKTAVLGAKAFAIGTGAFMGFRLIDQFRENKFNTVHSLSLAKLETKREAPLMWGILTTQKLHLRLEGKKNIYTAASVLSSFEQLKSLSLAGNGLNNQEISQIFNIIDLGPSPKLNHLEHLDLSDNNISDQGFENCLVRLFMSLPHLQSLNLSFNHLTATSIDQLFRYLIPASKVNSIDLSGNEITQIDEADMVNRLQESRRFPLEIIIQGRIFSQQPPETNQPEAKPTYWERIKTNASLPFRSGISQ